MIEKGDKVRFLNDIGGGTVSRIVGDKVYVEDVDGFEIPAKMSQVVLVEAKNKSKSSDVVKPDATIKGDISKVKSMEPSVFLAILQGDKAGSKTGDFRLYFVNYTALSISYFIFIEAKVSGQYELIYKGDAKPNQVVFIDKLPGRMIDDKNFAVQFVSYNSSGAFELKSPVTINVKLRAVKVAREGSFVKTAYFDESCYLLPLIKSAISKKIEQLVELNTSNKNSISVEKPKTVQKYKSGDTVEIDLHIHELIDNTSNLSNGEMLKIQIDKVNRTLELYKAIKGLRIVFIHGVGNGTLKQEVLKCLKTTYKSLYYQDASFKEYGYGATMVIV